MVMLLINVFGSECGLLIGWYQELNANNLIFTFTCNTMYFSKPLFTQFISDYSTKLKLD